MSPVNDKNPVGWLKPHEAEERFLPCPFCGCDPNVLELPSETIKGQTVWAVDCRNMGCVFQRSASYGLLRELVRDWNQRAVRPRLRLQSEASRLIMRLQNGIEAPGGVSRETLQEAVVLVAALARIVEGEPYLGE